MNRRGFLGAALAAGAGACASAAEPVRRSGKAPLRLSLAAYSFRQALDLKKPTMTLFDFADWAAGAGFDAVEPTGYYFPETTPEYIAKLKGHCTRLGLDVSGSAISNDFCVADAAKRAQQIEHVKKWVEVAARLGAKTLRIFAGSTPKGDSEDAARARCILAIEQACEHAGKFGVFLTLENHGGITGTPDQLLAIVKTVRSDWLGVNFDSGNFRTDDPYADLEKIAPYALSVQLKTEVQPKGKPKEEADLKRVVEMLRRANYRGYLALEYEAAEDAKTAIPRYAEALRKLVG